MKGEIRKLSFIWIRMEAYQCKHISQISYTICRIHHLSKILLVRNYSLRRGGKLTHSVLQSIHSSQHEAKVVT